MTTTHATLTEQGLDVLPATTFYRVSERDFGMPGLVAIESVGPFVELMRLGPFITIHDSFMEPGLGIGHHPHRGNERLFYIVRGRIEHDDALNRIRGTMHEGDLARLTEGERGMLHQEWNGRDDITTHAFILVYTPDVEPPIPSASFEALRADDRARVEEGDGVETLQLIGGRSSFRPNTSALTSMLDATLPAGSSLDLQVPDDEALILYPLEGKIRVVAGDGGETTLPAVSREHPEGPEALAIAWGGTHPRVTADEPSRLLRIGFRRQPDDVVLHPPWRSNR